MERHFRSVQEALFSGAPAEANASADSRSSLFLDETPAWLDKYKPGKLRRKRVEVFTTMVNPKTL
ncbi:MAG: hypothetical protein ACREIR_16655 [Geminicoccaceae bacterium]